MYQVLSIGGKDYKLEYTIEAALYQDCIESMMRFFGNVYGAGAIEDITKDVPDDQKNNLARTMLKNGMSEIINIPNVALTVFYAGLMEYHGPSGDNTVTSKDDAKKIVRNFFLDHKEDGNGNFYDLLSICIRQMGEDGFFEQTGLTKVLSNITKSEEAPKPNRAQRRAAKTTKKASEKSS